MTPTPTLHDAYDRAIRSGPVIPPSIVPPGSSTQETGIPAFGTQIQVLSDPGPPEVFTTIAGVGDIAGPNAALAEVETTSHSTGIAHRTFIPTLIDDGDISFPCYFNPSDPTHSLFSPFGLENLFQNRAVTKWRLVNTDPAHRTREFNGYVKTLGEDYPVAGVCTRKTDIRISGIPTDVFPTITLVPVSLPTETAAGGAHSITVTSTDTTIGWMPVSDSAWITITSPTDPVIGNGTVNYEVAASVTPTPARTGNIQIGNQTFTVSQAAGV
jgi:hypothetical protein